MTNIFKNRIVIGVVAVALALIIGFVAVPLFNALVTKTIDVVRVKGDVAMGTRITEDMLEIVEIGDINLPATPATKFSDVVGLYVTVDMKAHDVVYANKVAKQLTLPETKIRSMKAGEKTVTVKLHNAYYSRLLPNDIITFYQFDEEGNATIVPELRYVSVVSTFTSDGTHILFANQKGADGKELAAENIMLILSEKQIQKILTLENSKKYKITLAYRGTEDTGSATIDYYLGLQNSYLGINTNTNNGNGGLKDNGAAN